MLTDARFEFATREKVGKEKWDAFVDASDEAWLWHRFDLQDALATWPGRRDMSFALLDRNSGGRIVVVVPLHLIRKRIARTIPWNMLDSLGGPALANDLGRKERRKTIESVRDCLIGLASSHGAREIHLAIAPMTPAFRGERCPRVNPLLEMGCENTLTQTWVVDLRANKEVVWEHMEGRARTAIRKAEKTGVKVRVADKPEDLDLYYRLHCETYKRTGVPPHPRSYFEAIWNGFQKVNLARILFAELDGEVVAAESFGVYKKATVYWTGASSGKGLSVEANSLLQWTAMQWMIENGIEWYETGEAFPNLRGGKLKGLSDFKRSFGGVLYPFYRGRIEIGGMLNRVVNCLRALRGYR